MNNRATLIIGMMTGVIITYAVCMVLLYINEKYDEEISSKGSIAASNEKVNEESRYIYILSRDIKKFEMINTGDFYKYKIQSGNEDENEDRNKNENFIFANNEYEFKTDESLELEEKYMICDMRANSVIKKSDLMTRNELLVSIEKNAKFNSCELVAIPRAEDSRINTQTQSQDFQMSFYNNDYQKIADEFSFDKDIYVDIYYQNKVTYEVIEISKNIKVADITEDKITVILPNNEALKVKGIMQNENLFIKESQK